MQSDKVPAALEIEQGYECLSWVVSRPGKRILSVRFGEIIADDYC